MTDFLPIATVSEFLAATRIDADVTKDNTLGKDTLSWAGI